MPRGVRRIMTVSQRQALLFSFLLAFAAPGAARAQDAAMQPPAAQAAADAQPGEDFSGAADAGSQQASLEQQTNTPALASLLAPIALYPDALLASILTASTYPLEVVEADRWLQEPANAGLSSDQLLGAVQQKEWDPSVKALVPFPQILQLMDQQLVWTQQLGNAFLADQNGVMDVVQQLRLQAQQAAGLASTPQQSVTTDAQGEVEIQPTDPGQVSVPYYDPNTAYGAWPYPQNPPVAMPSYYDPGQSDPSLAGAVPGDNGWYFSPPIVLVEPIWFWCRFDWHHHRIDINRERTETLDPFHPHGMQTAWQHDPSHRHGVIYHDAAVRQRFQAANAAASAHPIPTVFTGMPEVRAARPSALAPPRIVAPQVPQPRIVAPQVPQPRQFAAPAAPRPAVPVEAVPRPANPGNAVPVDRPASPNAPRAVVPQRPVQQVPVNRPPSAVPAAPMGGRPSFYRAPIYAPPRPVMPAHFVMRPAVRPAVPAPVRSVAIARAR